MESFGFIESGIVFGLQDFSRLNNFQYRAKDFSVHGGAFAFVLDYVDQYNKFPPSVLLMEKFQDKLGAPGLEQAAVGIDFDYLVKVFRKQVLYRNAVEAIKESKDLLKEDPEIAISQISQRFEDIGLSYQDELNLYGMNSEERLSSYLRRKEMRQKGVNIIGLPTPFKTINARGVGWLPGELVSIFARPNIGKTWLCIKAAALAVKHNMKTLFITPEMPNEQLNLRFDAVIGKMYGYNFSHHDLKRGEGID